MTAIKRLEDYTEQELLDLTEEQTIELIDIECAFNGVRMLPELPAKPSSEKPQPTANMARVMNINHFANFISSSISPWKIIILQIAAPLACHSSRL